MNWLQRILLRLARHDCPDSDQLEEAAHDALMQSLEAQYWRARAHKAEVCREVHHTARDGGHGTYVGEL